MPSTASTKTEGGRLAIGNLFYESFDVPAHGTGNNDVWIETRVPAEIEAAWGAGSTTLPTAIGMLYDAQGTGGTEGSDPGKLGLRMASNSPTRISVMGR